MTTNDTTKPFPDRLRPRAFTLIELLTVIAIIGVLAGVLIATLGKVRQVARRAVCASNLRQTGLAVILFAQENKDTLPGPLNGTYGPYPKSINVTLLSYHIYGQVTGGRDINALGTRLSRVEIFACPAWSAKIPMEAQIANSGDSRSYMVSLAVRSTRGNNQLVLPFGYPASDPNQPSSMPLRFSEIASPARSWMITDLDGQLNSSYLSQSYCPATPVHGDVRNAVFFDAHVVARPASAFSLTTDSFNF
ncbi:MAG: type II secretion system GspH family protein [Opitutaceae bacterium]|jgi:prepilin-type N-terminal cleavage/methylation domain-containing protein|nr:type II secretion system GspH family protein [Opitutaceae bacterium]